MRITHGYFLHFSFLRRFLPFMRFPLSPNLILRPRTRPKITPNFVYLFLFEVFVHTVS